MENLFLPSLSSGESVAWGRRCKFTGILRSPKKVPLLTLWGSNCRFPKAVSRSGELSLHPNQAFLHLDRLLGLLLKHPLQEIQIHLSPYWKEKSRFTLLVGFGLSFS